MHLVGDVKAHNYGYDTRPRVVYIETVTTLCY